MTETEKWMKSAYAQFRLDGCTHEQAMAKINAAMDIAIPQAVDELMREAGIKTPAERAKAAQDERDQVAAIRARTEPSP